MSQLAPIRYEKNEAKILVRSFISGIFLGLPLSILANYILGFPAVTIRMLSSDLLDLAIALFGFLMAFLIVPGVLTAIFIIVFLRRENILSSYRLARALWAIIVFFIIFPLYVSVTYAVLDVLLGDSLARMSYTVFTLLVTPFVVLFFTIFIPQSRTGRMLRRLLHRSEKSNRHQSVA